ncbi:MAG TPA: antibiotic biosynthesis monooxygenase family protein [Vicinamibacterales bacterium]|nr:antibiotic biosynthesis monooxygenase family protein [Vicinamibacterales bacterium]
MSEKTSIYRVEKFVVPQAARDEFLKRIHDTHHVLRRQPGFIQDALLEQIAGPGRFNIVTIAEWESEEAIEASRGVVARAHEEAGFNPRETIARLGIEADIGD